MLAPLVPTRVLALFRLHAYTSPMPRPPLPIPLAAFGVRVADISNAWLELACCNGTTLLPIRTLGRQDATVGAILTKLRCRTCHQSPQSVSLIGKPHQGTVGITGGWSGWRVDLTRPA